MNTENITTLSSFKTFMTSNWVPGYVSRYCDNLGKKQWERFYDQMMIALKLTDEPEYLFYALKWILKTDFEDIAYEMYCHDMMDPECRDETLIRSAKWLECKGKYHTRFIEEYYNSHF